MTSEITDKIHITRRNPVIPYLQILFQFGKFGGGGWREDVRPVLIGRDFINGGGHHWEECPVGDDLIVQLFGPTLDGVGKWGDITC